MQRDRSPAQPAAAHRPWCAPECAFPPGAVEGTHLGRAWTLAPVEGDQLSLRLFQQVGENDPGEVGVLVSITERRLPDDLDPLGEGAGTDLASGLADISSSAGLSAGEAAELAAQIAGFVDHLPGAGQ